MGVETPSIGLIFPRQSIWGVTCLGLLEKWMIFHLSAEKPQKCTLKPSEQGSFFQDDRFEGSLAYVYLKNEHFPIYLLRNPINGVETLRIGLIFLRQSFWGVTCLGLLEKWTFSHLSPWKPHKCVLKPSEQGSFFWDDWFEGSRA